MRHRDGEQVAVESQAGLAPADLLSLIGACLALEMATPSVMAWRLRFRDDPELLSVLHELANQERLGSAFAWALLQKRLILPARHAASDPQPHPVQLTWAQHEERMRRLRAVLLEVLALANAAGVTPTLLKGGQALWSGEPPWRHLRDVDLLVGTKEEAILLQQQLRKAGFAPYPGRKERASRHHLTPLFRDDFPGWMEVHRRGGNAYAERILGTSELLASALPDLRDGVTVRLLPPGSAALYGMVHHHVGHSAYARGTISPKGLYEFAVAAAALSAQERNTMVQRATRNPRLAALLDFWTAAAHDLFAMPVEAPLRLAADARARSAAALRRYGLPGISTVSGYHEELEMALAPERLRRSAKDGGRLGAWMKGVGVVAAMLPSPFRPTR